MDLDRRAVAIGNNPALIVVDMINGFTDPSCPLGCECSETVAANKALLDVFRKKKKPIFFTTVIYSGPEQAKVFRQRLPALNVLEPGSHWVEIDAALEPMPGEEVIEKCWASSFFATDLIDRLREKNVDSLVVTGLTTSGCVRATVVDGLQHDFPVLVPREAVADRNIKAHEANLFDMNAKYADVVSVQDVINQLSG